MSADSEVACWPQWLPDCSPEQRFLLAFVGHATQQRECEWRRVLPALDWYKLFELTPPQTYPYLHFCLQTKLDVPLCPQDLLARLAGARRMTALHNLRLLAELRSLHKLFASANIPFLALKGIVLGPSAYGDISLRPMHDLDLLVPPERGEQARALLRQACYETPDRIAAKHPALAEQQQNSDCAPGMQKCGTRVLVEVHTQLEIGPPAFHVNLNELWERAVDVSLNGLPVRTLCPDDFLAHLCVHLSLTHEYSTGLLPLIDVLKFVESHGPCFRWEQLTREWHARGYAAYMRLTLSMARDLLATPVPASVFAISPELASARQTVWRQLWDDRRLSHAVPEGLVRVLARPTLATRAHAFINRLRPMYEFNLWSREQRRQGLRTALLRILVALRVQLPKYLRAIFAGNIRPSRVKRAVSLMREREHLASVLRNDSSSAA